MSQALIKSLPTLLVVAKASPKLIRLILRESDEDLFVAIQEILKNIWENTVILTPSARKILAKEKGAGGIEQILNKTTNKKKRKELISRRGPTLLPLVLPSVLPQLLCHKNEICCRCGGGGGTGILSKTL